MKQAWSKLSVSLTVVALAAVPIGVSLGQAHDGAKGVVKQRMDAMKELGSAAKTLGQMFKGQQKYDPAMVAKLAGEMAAKADRLPAMFPKGSEGPPSDTMPSAWSDRAGFEKGFAALKMEASKLAEMAPKAPQQEVMAQFFKTAGTCRSCHTSYRKPK